MVRAIQATIRVCGSIGHNEWACSGGYIVYWAGGSSFNDSTQDLYWVYSGFAHGHRQRSIRRILAQPRWCSAPKPPIRY